jgi:hypothetical protein
VDDAILRRRRVCLFVEHLEDEDDKLHWPAAHEGVIRAHGPRSSQRSRQGSSWRRVHEERGTSGASAAELLRRRSTASQPWCATTNCPILRHPAAEWTFVAGGLRGVERLE